MFGAVFSGGRIVIRDHVMEASRTEPRDGAIFAVNMLVNTEGGSTYTYEEYDPGSRRRDSRTCGISRRENTWTGWSGLQTMITSSPAPVLNISLILAHPTEGSFNHAIADRWWRTLHSRRHKVFFHDLYREKFYPVLTTEEIPENGLVPQEIEAHCREIAEADGIVIVHPNWWGQPPAILKGWVDRVIRPGVAYEFLESDQGEGVPRWLLKAKTAIVFNTSNTPLQREQDIFGDPLERLWKN